MTSPLHDFKALTPAPKPPDSPLMRLYVYACLTVVLSCAFAAAAFLWKLGLLDRHRHHGHHGQTLVSVEDFSGNVKEANERITLVTTIAAVAGAITGVVISVRMERRNK